MSLPYHQGGVPQSLESKGAGPVGFLPSHRRRILGGGFRHMTWRYALDVALTAAAVLTIVGLLVS